MRSTEPCGRACHISSFKVDRFKRLAVRELARRPFLKDASIVHLRLPARTSLPKIMHERTSELIYVLSGSMTGTLDSRARRLRAGSVVFIPPGVWHKFATAQRACEAIAVFTPELVIRKGADVHAEPGVSLWD